MLSLESSVNDVLSIVITIALVQAYLDKGEFQWAKVTGDLIASFLVAVVFGAAGALIWSRLLNRIHAIKNAMFTTAAFVFIIFGVAEILNFSGAIAALAFGITIGNVESIRFYIFRRPQATEVEGLNTSEKAFFSEVAFLLKTFFFVYLGISLELISGWLIQLALILTAVIFLLRIPAVKVTVRKSIPARDASIVAIMVPKGLAAAVLAIIPLQAGVLGGELIKNVTYGVVLSSIVFTSIMLLLLEKTGLSALYIWFYSLDRQKIAGYGQRLASIPAPDLSGFQARVSSIDISKLPRNVKTLSSGTRTRIKAFFHDFGRPGEYRFNVKDKKDKTKK